MNKHFWNWTQSDDEMRHLNIDGVIASESWFGDEVTPEQFKAELGNSKQPVMVHINSCGGDCIAASRIYTMLMDYPGDVTVQIDSLAASAASVIAMAGSHVSMSPTALMMIHNPWTSACGDAADLQKTCSMLDEVKESIINAYQLKSGLSRKELSDLMDAETWLNAHRAKELGLCDEVMYEGNPPVEKVSFDFSAHAAAVRLMNAVRASAPAEPTPVPKPSEPKKPENPENRITVRNTDERLEHLRF